MRFAVRVFASFARIAERSRRIIGSSARSARSTGCAKLRGPSQPGSIGPGDVFSADAATDNERTNESAKVKRDIVILRDSCLRHFRSSAVRFVEEYKRGAFGPGLCRTVRTM